MRGVRRVLQRFQSERHHDHVARDAAAQRADVQARLAQYTAAGAHSPVSHRDAGVRGCGRNMTRPELLPCYIIPSVSRQMRERAMSDDELGLRPYLVGVDQQTRSPGERQLKLLFTRGEIPIIVHVLKKPGRAVLCISGALGGFDGPAKLSTRGWVEASRCSASRCGRAITGCSTSSAKCVFDTMAGLPVSQSDAGAETRRSLTPATPSAARSRSTRARLLRS